MELYNIDELIMNVEQSAVCLYKNDIMPVQDILGDIVNKVNRIYKELIADSIKYRQSGIEIPGEILCNQLKNLSDAISQSDIIGIADTLNYEIKQGLLFYKEVKGIAK